MRPRSLMSQAIHLTFAVTLGVATLAASAANGQELLGYWRLEETNFDADVIDSSGNLLNGLFDGFEIDPDVAGAPGFGSGVLLDGETDRIIIEDFENEGVFGNLVNDFTVMAWINPNSFDSKNRIFGGFPTGGGWGFGTSGDMLEITTYGVRDYDQPVPLELDTWTHVAVTLDTENAANFYVNGAYVGTQTHDAPGIPTENDFYIGASCCDAEYFSGYLDEVAVFSGVLDERQISNAANLAVPSYDAPPVNPDGLRFQLDFGISTTNGNIEFGVPEGWDSINEILAEDTCDYLGNAETPCTIFALTDQEGTDNDVTLEILEFPFITNATPNDTIPPNVFNGTAIPLAAIGDYQYKDPDTANTSAPFRFSNLDPGTYEVTVARDEAMTVTVNSRSCGLATPMVQMSREWRAKMRARIRADFAAGAATLTLEVGEGDFLWYRHLEDGSGGISALVIRSVGEEMHRCAIPTRWVTWTVTAQLISLTFSCCRLTLATRSQITRKGDIDCNGTVEFADFLVLSANFGQAVGAESGS